MSVELLQERLARYKSATSEEELMAVREVTQELVLAALARGDFFSRASFQGGTCLRIAYGIKRFSEDLDFALRLPDPDFSWASYGKGIQEELAAYGYKLELKDGGGEADRAVKRMFVKDDAVTKSLGFEHLGKAGVTRKLLIKLEADTNPPAGAWYTRSEMTFPYRIPLVTDDPPTLFSGKLAALLSRPYEKGRDWYDFLWNTGRGTAVNLPFLEASLDQCGPWTGQHVKVDATWLVEQLTERIDGIEWTPMKKDIRRFVQADEREAVEAWTEKQFHTAASTLDEKRLLHRPQSRQD